MPALKKNLGFGWLTRKRETYHRDVGAERKELQREAMAERFRQMQLKKIRAQELAAEAKIRAAERKIAAAEQKIEVAAQKASRGASRASGGLSESEFERIKAHMESEISKQEVAKRAALAKVGNPSWGYGVYQGRGFSTEQIAHFKSRVAAETYARSHGLTGYRIQRAFAKNPKKAYYDSLKRLNPAGSAAQYRLAQAVLSGTARKRGMPRKVAREIVERTPAHLRSDYARASNPCESSTEYQLGYSLGQTDRQNAALHRTISELDATFRAKFDPARASELVFAEGYEAGYGLAGGTTAGSPSRQNNSGFRRNPESADDEYPQAKRIAELFHGRPVKEEVDFTEDIREHDWLWRIGPIVSLKVAPLSKKPAKTVLLPFAMDEANMVHLFCSPDGRQFYLRGGDQELDLKASGMGPGSEWYRDQMLIGEAKEITYQDKKKFHHFKLTDYYHKLGEVTKKKPMLAYDSLAHKLSIIGGQYKIETDDLVDGMSPGIVN